DARARARHGPRAGAAPHARAAARHPPHPGRRRLLPHHGPAGGRAGRLGPHGGPAAAL
ncbi:MAG: hypothetical protein AVDCRST_MAG13-2120, partial [uncultured Solirubrobacteraceae bacterium]